MGRIRDRPALWAQTYKPQRVRGDGEEPSQSKTPASSTVVIRVVVVPIRGTDIKDLSGV